MKGLSHPDSHKPRGGRGGHPPVRAKGIIGPGEVRMVCARGGGGRGVWSLTRAAVPNLLRPKGPGVISLRVGIDTMGSDNAREVVVSPMVSDRGKSPPFAEVNDIKVSHGGKEEGKVAHRVAVVAPGSPLGAHPNPWGSVEDTGVEGGIPGGGHVPKSQGASVPHETQHLPQEVV